MRMDISTNDKRIVKNTLLLYIRQLVVLAAELYISRAVLKILGVTDFGIYNVVAGVVVMFSFLMTTLSSASQRFLSYDLAKGDSKRLKETFSMVMLSAAFLVLITIILIESFSVWFLNTQMTIPDDRLFAANWVLQFAILSYSARFFSFPFLSVINSHEKMSAYAYISMADVCLKLMMVSLLPFLSYDKLVAYSILMFANSLFIFLFYRYYCHCHFVESHFSFFYEKKRMSEICNFAWWNMIGLIANLLRNQGVNALLNVFFNPAINAARGIAYQVNGAITSFSGNFYAAVQPQIVKNYAVGECEKMRSLIMMSSRLAFYLLLLLSLPVILNAKQILVLWLDTPPVYTDLFMQLILITAMLEVFSLPLGTGMQATGQIKTYQLVVSGVYLLNIPVSYLFLKNGFPPETVMYVNLVLVAVDITPRLYFCKKYYGLSIRKFISEVIFKTWPIALACFFIGKIVVSYVNNGQTIMGLALSIILSLTIVAMVVLLVGLNKEERIVAVQFVKRKLIRK